MPSHPITEYLPLGQSRRSDSDVCCTIVGREPKKPVPGPLKSAMAAFSAFSLNVITYLRRFSPQKRPSNARTPANSTNMMIGITAATRIPQLPGGIITTAVTQAVRPRETNFDSNQEAQPLVFVSEEHREDLSTRRLAWSGGSPRARGAAIISAAVEGSDLICPPPGNTSGRPRLVHQPPSGLSVPGAISEVYQAPPRLLISLRRYVGHSGTYHFAAWWLRSRRT